MIVKKSILYVGGVIFLVALGIIFLFSNSGSALSQNSFDNKEVQIAKLSVQNGKYVLEPSELKKNIPVRIEADLSQMPGCSRSIVIFAFGVSKTFSSNDNFVEFVPNKAGTFIIACSMNMYRGTFTILESDGTNSDYVEKNTNTKSSCGMEGCGCGVKW